VLHEQLLHPGGARCRLSRKEWAGEWVTTTALNVLRRSFRTRNGSRRPDHEMMGGRSRKSSRSLCALQSPPLRQRQAATLYYVADLPVSEVAEAMQLTEGNTPVVFREFDFGAIGRGPLLRSNPPPGARILRTVKVGHSRSGGLIPWIHTSGRLDLLLLHSQTYLVPPTKPELAAVNKRGQEGHGPT
jgi:hypothetical protein